MICKVTRYITEDGKSFNSEKEALEYESIMEIRKRLSSFLENESCLRSYDCWDVAVLITDNFNVTAK